MLVLVAAAVDSPRPRPRRHGAPAAATHGPHRSGAAFDGSPDSEAAVAAAHALAAQSGGELVVLQAVATTPVPAAGDATRCSLTTWSPVADGVPVSGELLDGDAGEEPAARSADLDLLVVGSKGHGAIGRVLLGSVSHHLMCESTSPVLVARR